MLREILRAKIHGAKVTEANVEYTGSITIDERLLDESGINQYEKVLVGDMENGARFTTYAIAGKRDSGVVCVNGAAAKLVEVGDKLIILCFGLIDDDEIKGHKPKIIYVDGENKIK
ncbi:MAG: aspartate 1-decarboxylase [Methanobacteriota archaeon]